MNLNLFDTYNIRARLSVYVIVISPIILTIYFLFESVRTFSFSAIFVAILFAFSNYLFALQRFFQKQQPVYKNIAAELLYKSDPRIDNCTKQRYYNKLSQLDKSFKIFKSPSDNDDFKNACTSAITWLRNNTREIKLVQEENMLYGFYKNLMSFKFIGLISTTIAIIILLLTSMPVSTKDFLHTPTYVVLLLFDTFCLILWSLGTSKKICQILAEKYAYALLGTLDYIKD